MPTASLLRVEKSLMVSNNCPTDGDVCGKSAGDNRSDQKKRHVLRDNP